MFNVSVGTTMLRVRDTDLRQRPHRLSRFVHIHKGLGPNSLLLGLFLRLARRVPVRNFPVRGLGADAVAVDLVAADVARRRVKLDPAGLAEEVAVLFFLSRFAGECRTAPRTEKARLVVFAQLRHLNDGAAPDDLRATAAGSNVPLCADVGARDTGWRFPRLSCGDRVIIVGVADAELDAHDRAKRRVCPCLHRCRLPPRIEDAEAVAPVAHAVVDDKILYDLGARGRASVPQTFADGSHPFTIAGCAVFRPRIVPAVVRRYPGGADVGYVIFSCEV